MNAHSQVCSNNTNKLSPQEPARFSVNIEQCSNNTNKLSPQEHTCALDIIMRGSNNTNKLSPQELTKNIACTITVQIIQINLVLKN